MKTKKPKPPRVFAPLPCGAVLLSLDVSSSCTGWAVARIKTDVSPEILDFGVLKAPSGRTSIDRADWMGMKIAYLLQKHGVASVVMEHQSHMSSGKRIQGLAVLGQAQGSIRAYLAMTHRVEAVSEREWTRFGAKNTKKEVRAEYVKKMVPAYAAMIEANPKFDPGLDCADALGLLIFRVKQ